MLRRDDIQWQWQWQRDIIYVETPKEKIIHNTFSLRKYKLFVMVFSSIQSHCATVLVSRNIAIEISAAGGYAYAHTHTHLHP